MKQIFLLLLVFLLNSCSQFDRCTLNFGKQLDFKFFKIWEVNTKRELLENMDQRSISLLNLKDKYGVSFFDRDSFFAFLKCNSRSLNEDFNKLWILEVNHFGEKNQSIKYLIGICNEDVSITKYVLGIRGWIVFEKKELHQRDIQELFQFNKSVEKNYQRINESNNIACLTQIDDKKDVKVNTYMSLNSSQLRAIRKLYVIQ